MSDRTPPSQPEGPREEHEATDSAGDAAPPRGGPLEELDPVALRRWAFRARAALARHRGGIDALNVFPVPDGDTGTNMLATLTGALRAARPGPAGGTGVAEEAPGRRPPEPGADAGGSRPQQSEPRADASPAEASGDAAAAHESEASRLDVVARTSVTAARGNSGAILGELLRGLAQVAGAGRARIDGPTLATALRTASERAWLAVGRPVDGTMLSVARAAAAAADQTARSGGQLVDVTAAAVEAARGALASTPEQLPTLKHAGVVDAGGAGLLVVLTALHDVVTGGRTREKLPTAAVRGESVDEGGPGAGSPSPGTPDPRAGGRHPAEPDEAMSEVMYVVTGADPAARTRLREDLDGLGDSVVVAGDSRAATVHVHTSRIEAAVSHGRAAGEVSDLRVESLVAAGAQTTRDAGRLPTRRSVLVHRLSADLGDGLPGLAGLAGLPIGRREEASAAVILVTDRADDPAPVSHGQPEGAGAVQQGPPRHVVRCDSVPAALAALAVYDDAGLPPASAESRAPAGSGDAAGDAEAVQRTVDAMRAAAQAVTTIALPRRLDDDSGDDSGDSGDSGDDRSEGGAGDSARTTSPGTSSKTRPGTSPGRGEGPSLTRPSRGGLAEFVARVDAAIEAGGELVTIVAGPDGVATAAALAQDLGDRDVEVARFVAAEPLADCLVVVGVE